VADSTGKFVFCRFDGYSFERNKRFSFEGGREFCAEEREFLFKSFKNAPNRPVIVLSKRSETVVLLPALAFNFSVVLKYYPKKPFSLCDLRAIEDLREDISASPAALAYIKQSCGAELDFTDRVSRLLNVNSFLARGAQFKKNSHDLVGAANSFAENFSFMCGAQLRIDREYPEVVYPEGYDFSLLGLILVAALYECDSSRCPRISHTVESSGALFVNLSVFRENEETLGRALSLAHRLNLPISVERDGDLTRICFSPIRPEVSLLGLKQPFYLDWSESGENLFEYD
jgi:hypothetical protein